jgi:hypothetical protein
MADHPLKRAAPQGDAVPRCPAKAGTKRKADMKFRLYKLAFALASLAAIAEMLGAGRRF